MIPALMHPKVPQGVTADDGAFALVVARHPDVRAAIAGLLFEAGLRVTTVSTFGVVEVLLEAPDTFDLMVVAQTLEETTLFGVPQLARSVDPDTPILVLDALTAAGPAIAELADDVLQRWPLREFEAPALH